jgi:Demerecviridae HNH endonuclease
MSRLPKPPENLADLFAYKRDGNLVWLVSRGSIKPGRIAGSPSISKGRTYIYIKIGKVSYRAHHIVWFLCKGEWPTHDIDHRDSDGTNNRIGNLRKCTSSQNQANSKRRADNSSGYKGVSFNREQQMFIAAIQINRERKFLGYFKTAEEAHAAYVAAARKHFKAFARPA